MASRLRIVLQKMIEHRRNERLTRAELEARKLVEFRKLVRWAHERSPYYGALVRERGIDPDRCEPSDFPPLTKSELMASFDDFVTDPRVTKEGVAHFLTRSADPRDLFLDEYRVIHTSGSSGEVGYFLFSKEDWARGLATGLRRRPEWRVESRAGRKRRAGRLRVAFYGAIGGHFGGVTMVSAARQGIARLFVNVGLFEVNDPLPDTVAALNEFRPDILTGYTGGLMVLATKQREGALRICPRAVGTAGESMSPFEKATLEESFGCVARNGYASSEHLGMGYSIPNRNTMLLRDDELIYELFPDHILVTNLFNYTLPLIRYRMSDILRPVAEKTDPDSPYLEIEALVGRSEIMPTFLNGEGDEDYVSPHTINELFVAGVTRFQMQLTGGQSFRFLVCLDRTLDGRARREARGQVERRLREILEHKGLGNVCFEVAVVDDIPVNPRSRKFQLIMDARGSA